MPSCGVGRFPDEVPSFGVLSRDEREDPELGDRGGFAALGFASTSSCVVELVGDDAAADAARASVFTTLRGVEA